MPPEEQALLEKNGNTVEFRMWSAALEGGENSHAYEDWYDEFVHRISASDFKIDKRPDPDFPSAAKRASIRNKLSHINDSNWKPLVLLCGACALPFAVGEIAASLPELVGGGGTEVGVSEAGGEALEGGGDVLEGGGFVDDPPVDPAESGDPECGEDGPCFVGSTLVATSDGEVPIDEIHIGERVLTRPKGEPEPSRTSVVPGEWREVRLSLPDPTGHGRIKADLLARERWVKLRHVAVGTKLSFALREMGLSGTATISFVGPCPPVEKGRGRVVLGTLSIPPRHVLELTLKGGFEPIECTPNHRLFSADRHRWVAARTLRVGESLATESGSDTVTAISRVPGAHCVFNLLIESDHMYYAGSEGVLAHNDGCNDEPRPRSKRRIGRRLRFNTRKKAEEAARRAGNGADPVNDANGPHGPHFHPGDGNGKPLNHDHYYYPHHAR